VNVNVIALWQFGTLFYILTVCRERAFDPGYK